LRIGKKLIEPDRRSEKPRQYGQIGCCYSLQEVTVMGIDLGLVAMCNCLITD